MAERIRRIKQKRREKLGLPPLEQEEGAGDKDQGEVQCCGAGPTLARFRLPAPAPDNNIFVTQI